MDPDVIIMFNAPCGKLISREKLKVHLSDNHNRKPLPPDMEQDIGKVWRERVEKNPTLWNGTKFRLDAIQMEGEHCIFKIGITSYRDFLGTNWSPLAKQINELGTHKFNNSQVYMSDALGVGSFVVTSDNYVIFLRRSKLCGEAQGLLDIPGGHPEPKALVGKLEMEEIDLEKLSDDDVVNEIFNSTLQEIVDEVNIPISCLTDPLLLGVARNTTSAGRPSSEYLVRCSLSSEQVKKLYQEGSHAEADESIGIVLLPYTQVLELHDKHRDMWNDLAPSAKGCVWLMVQANEVTPNNFT